MRADLARRRRAEEEALPPGEETRPHRHPVLDLQSAAGNAAVTRMLARQITGADRPAMASRWGKTKDLQKQHLQELGPQEAYKAIAAFCEARKRAKNAPTLKDVMDDLGLTAAEVEKPPEQEKVVEGFTFAMNMTNHDGVETGLDDHQNKHQYKKIFGLKDYSGGDADNKYGPYANAAWHRLNTAPIAERWALQLKRAGSLDPAGTQVQSSTGENLLNEGHLFVATALKDSKGVLYVSYHCYPEVTDV